MSGDGARERRRALAILSEEDRIPLAGASLVMMLLAVANLGPGVAAHPTLAQVTWNDVSPILERRCVACHTRDGFAPMSLEDFDAARPWARQIRREVLERRMPPWPAARGVGEFANDRSLTRRELEIVTAWADAGAPAPAAGVTVNRTPAPPSLAFDMLLNVPVVSRPKPLESLDLGTPIESPIWIAGWDLNPGSARLVQHATLRLTTGDTIGTWVPGESATTYPAGFARRLPAGVPLHLDVQFGKATTLEAIRSAVVLRLSKPPAREVESRAFSCGATALAADIDALSVQPHSDQPGDVIEVVARLPDRTVQPLLVVLEYSPHHPLTYRFRTPIRLPGGTLLDIRSRVARCGARIEYAVTPPHSPEPRTRP